jgi:ribonuclease HI
VFARVDAQGELVERDGRVEIKYRAEDPRLYSARASDLAIIAGESDRSLPDAPGESEAATAPRAAKKKSRAASSMTSRRGMAAPRRSGRKNAVAVYTDGACSGNPGPAGLGVVLLFRGKRKEISEYLGEATNNVAELTAVLRGLQAIRDPSKPVDIYSDSAYSIGVLSLGWKPKANQELIAEIKGEMARFHDLAFVKVAGHAGVPENERADALAREAVASRSRRRSER